MNRTLMNRLIMQILAQTHTTTTISHDPHLHKALCLSVSNQPTVLPDNAISRAVRAQCCLSVCLCTAPFELLNQMTQERYAI